MTLRAGVTLRSVWCKVPLHAHQEAELAPGASSRLYTEGDKSRRLVQICSKRHAMPRKTRVARPSASALPLAIMTNGVVIQADVVKIPAKRALLELESAGDAPAIQLGPPAVEASKRARQLTIGVAPLTFYYLEHESNPGQKFLVRTCSPGKNGIKVYFVDFPFTEFYYSPAVMPDIKFLPHGPDAPKPEHTPWWVSTGGVEVIARSMPMPAAGFGVGNFVSFPGSRGSFGKVLFVFTRSNGQHLYFIGAEKDQRRRLLLETVPHISGPELSFEKPRTCWFDPDVFPAIHVGDPDRYDYYEVPVGGFHLGDPVTVFAPGSRLPLHGEISFITTTAQYVLPVSYGVKVLSTGEQVRRPYNEVFGPSIGRFTPFLRTGLSQAGNPVTPSRGRGIITVREVDEIGMVGPYWEEDDGPQQALQTPAPAPGVSLPSFPVAPPVTPVQEMTRLSVRNHHVGFVDLPWPGALLARLCARGGTRSGAAPPDDA